MLPYSNKIQKECLLGRWEAEWPESDMRSRKDNMLTSLGFSLPSPTSSHFHGLWKEKEKPGRPEGECGILRGQPGFRGQDGNHQRKRWDGGGSSPDVLEFLRVAEGSEALERNPREGLRGCQAPRNQRAGGKGGPGCRAGR